MFPLNEKADLSIKRKKKKKGGGLLTPGDKKENTKEKVRYSNSCMPGKTWSMEFVSLSSFPPFFLFFCSPFSCNGLFNYFSLFSTLLFFPWLSQL